MATIGTFATLWDEFSDFCKVLDLNWQNDVIESNNFQANLEALQAQHLDNEWKARKESAAISMLAARSSALMTGAVQWWIAWLDNMSAVIGAKTTGLGLVSSGEFFEYMHANSENVTYRNVTRGSWSWTTSANSIPTSNIITFGEDAYNYSIEDVPTYRSASTDYVHEMLCLSDPQTGTSPGLFQWYLTGQQKKHQLHDFTSMGPGVLMAPAVGCVSIDDSSILQNADFSQSFSGSGADKIPGWYVSAGDAADVTLNTTAGNGYAAKRGTITLDDTDGDFYQLAFARDGTTEAKIEQYITTQIRTDVPYLCAAVFKGDGSADGTVTLTLGSQSIVSGTVSTSNTIIYIGSSDNNDAWYRTFASDPLSVSFQRTGSPTAGVVYLHGIYLFPVTTYHAGRYGILLEGTDFFRRDDLATATDAVGNTPAAGTSQYWWWRLCMEVGIPARWRYLPHGSSASTDAHDYS